MVRDQSPVTSHLPSTQSWCTRVCTCADLRPTQKVESAKMATNRTLPACRCTKQPSWNRWLCRRALSHRAGRSPVALPCNSANTHDVTLHTARTRSVASRCTPRQHAERRHAAHRANTQRDVTLHTAPTHSATSRCTPRQHAARRHAAHRANTRQLQAWSHRAFGGG
jgi:hypothetical protein